MKKLVVAVFLAAVSIIGIKGVRHVSAITTDLSPSVSYFVNGIDGASSIVTANAGDTLNITWSANNVAYCKKWGVWGAGEVLGGLAGTDLAVAPSPTVVTGYNYEIDCYDASGALLVQGGAQVNVNPAVVSPSPTPTPAPSAVAVKYKGEGKIVEFNVDYLLVGNTKLLISAETKIKLISGSIAVGKIVKWQGTSTTGSSLVSGTRLEVQ